ncbi:MAG: terminase TerL endonuclease subunit, partial [Oscillospiraceae bacterium]
PYRWDYERSEDILDFAETLTIIEGLEPTPIKLYGCQEFDLGVPMGWLKDNGNRKFRRKYKSVARQNGKTFENGITGTYLGGFYGYRYGKIFTVATDKRQARLAWEKMANFIRADPELAEYFNIKDYISLITAINTGCTVEALSKEAGLKEGFASIFASIDEIHQHRDNSIYKAMYNGQRAMLEALISMITTRGKEINTFCYEFDRYCLSVLDGGSTAEDLFADIYSLDEKDNIFDPKKFLKSNPVLCATEHGMEIQLSDAQTAKDMGGDELADYMVKCQNMWLESSDSEFASAKMLKKCRCNLKLKDFYGKAAYVGLDLSHGGDLTSFSLEFEVEADKYYDWSLSFMPRGRLIEHMKTDVAPYDLWEQMGLLLVTGGESDFKNNYAFIISELRRIQKEFNIKFLGIGYDPHNADAILQELETFGAPLLEITQSAKFLNDGTVDMQLLMKSGLYLYDQENELIDMSFRNAKTVKNSFGEKKVDKNPLARTKRIDPVDAAIDAHVTRMKLSGKSVFDANAAMEAYLIKMGLMEGKKDEEKA